LGYLFVLTASTLWGDELATVCKSLKQNARNLELLRNACGVEKLALKELQGQFYVLKDLAREVNQFSVQIGITPEKNPLYSVCVCVQVCAIEIKVIVELIGPPDLMNLLQVYKL
jgi:hypothetical protein